MKLADAALAAVLVATAVLTIRLAAIAPYLPDESGGYIRLADSISLTPGSLNLELRANKHPALVGYVVKVSRSMFGSSPLGTRALHVLAGLLGILVAARIARHWYGPVAGAATAALLAFNEYHLQISSVATSHAPHLLFVTLAMYGGHRFIVTRKPVFFYVTSLAVAAAYYCKEHSVLLFLVFLAFLLRKENRATLKQAHPYLAAALFLLLISPDVAWNLNPVNQVDVTYRDHLSRIGGIGISPHPLAFYGRTFVQWLDIETFSDPMPEYASMNPAAGFLLLGAVAWLSWSRRGHLRPLLLCQFWVIFTFFSLIRAGRPARVDPAGWAWVDMTLPAAAIAGGALLVLAPTWFKAVAWSVAIGAMGYAVMEMWT